MPLEIELNKKPKKKSTWDNLEYGDVFETYEGVAMKVFDYNNKTDYILFLDEFDMYSDVENYKIIKIINCKLVEE